MKVVHFRGIEEGRLQPLVRYRQGQVRTSHRGLALSITVRPRSTVTDEVCIPPQQVELQIPMARTKSKLDEVYVVGRRGDGVGVARHSRLIKNGQGLIVDKAVVRWLEIASRQQGSRVSGYNYRWLGDGLMVEKQEVSSRATDKKAKRQTINAKCWHDDRVGMENRIRRIVEVRDEFEGELILAS